MIFRLMMATKGCPSRRRSLSCFSFLVLARMDRLRPEHKRALQAASVIGQRFNADVLRHLLEATDYDCQALLEHNLVTPGGCGGCSLGRRHYSGTSSQRHEGGSRVRGTASDDLAYRGRSAGPALAEQH